MVCDGLCRKENTACHNRKNRSGNQRKHNNSRPRDGDGAPLRLLTEPPRVGLSTRQTEVLAADPHDRQFVPPRLADLPEDGWGELVRYGRKLFVDTQTHGARFVSNGSCCSTSAHLSGSAPRIPAMRRASSTCAGPML